MFDIGFWELLLIFVLALLILGPERLPRLAMAAGRWLGRARAMARSLRVQLEQEIDRPAPPAKPEPRGSAPAGPPGHNPADSDER